jgi:glycerate kinase
VVDGNDGVIQTLGDGRCTPHHGTRVYVGQNGGSLSRLASIEITNLWVKLRNLCAL